MAPERRIKAGWLRLRRARPLQRRAFTGCLFEAPAFDFWEQKEVVPRAKQSPAFWQQRAGVLIYS